jgi:hypothetical protein
VRPESYLVPSSLCLETWQASTFTQRSACITGHGRLATKENAPTLVATRTKHDARIADLLRRSGSWSDKDFGDACKGCIARFRAEVPLAWIQTRAIACAP